MFDNSGSTDRPAPDEGLDGAARRARLAELDGSIGEEAGNIAAAMCSMLADIGEFDALGGWVDAEVTTLEQWLSWRIGISGAPARDCALVARKLGALPALKAAFGAGEVSFSKARAICSIATPETEAMLVDWARSSTAVEMDRIARAWNKMRADELLVENEAKRASRSCTYYVADDGMLLLKARLMAEEGAVVARALEQIADQDTDAAGEDRSPEQRSADALVAVAERSLTADGEPADRHLATVHIDLDVLTENNPSGRCEVYPGAGSTPPPGSACCATARSWR